MRNPRTIASYRYVVKLFDFAEWDFSSICFTFLIPRKIVNFDLNTKSRVIPYIILVFFQGLWKGFWVLFRLLASSIGCANPSRRDKRKLSLASPSVLRSYTRLNGSLRLLVGGPRQRRINIIVREKTSVLKIGVTRVESLATRRYKDHYNDGGAGKRGARTAYPKNVNSPFRILHEITIVIRVGLYGDFVWLISLFLFLLWVAAENPHENIHPKTFHWWQEFH